MGAPVVVLAWSLLLVSVGLVLVVPVAAAWLRDGMHWRATALVCGFALVCAWSPAEAGPAPGGGTQIGVGGATVTCTAGASLFYVFDYSDWMYPEGQCSGSHVCGSAIVASSGNAASWHGAGKCWEVPTGEGDGGEDTPQRVEVVLPDLSIEEAMNLAGAVAALWAAAWAFRALRQQFASDDGESTSDRS